MMAELKSIIGTHHENNYGRTLSLWSYDILMQATTLDKVMKFTCG